MPRDDPNEGRSGIQLVGGTGADSSNQGRSISARPHHGYPRTVQADLAALFARSALKDAAYEVDLLKRLEPDGMIGRGRHRVRSWVRAAVWYCVGHTT